jgi:ribonuclease Z
MIPFELTILGTSSALPTSKRYPTAHVLNVRERFFLIDCGEGTQLQIRKYGVKLSRINHIFISHLHGDHYFGLIGLLSTFALLGRKNDLHIYSHSELPEILKTQLEYLGEDIDFKIIWHPLNYKKPAVILDNGVVSVTSFPVKHRIPCCGFLFCEKPLTLNIIKEKIAEFKIPLRDIQHIKNGSDFIDEAGNIIPNSVLTIRKNLPRKYAFITDTMYLPELSELLQGVDLLYHEATYDRRLQKRLGETFHSTAEQAALLAKASNARQLVIGHFSARYKEVDLLLDEATAIFPNTIAAEEGMVIKVEGKQQEIGSPKSEV